MPQFDFEKEETAFDLQYAVEQAQQRIDNNRRPAEMALEALLILEEKELKHMLRSRMAKPSRYAIGITNELFTAKLPFGTIDVYHRLSYAYDDQLRQWSEKLLAGKTIYHIHAENITSHVIDNIPLAEIEIDIDIYDTDEQPSRQQYSEVMSYYDTIQRWMSDGRVFLELVEQRAWKMKAAQIAEIMSEQTRGERKPIVFLDGPLLPQLHHKRVTHEKVYLDLINDMLTMSTETKVPIVGAVIAPQENYLSYFLSRIDHKCPSTLADTALLSGHLLKMGRTPAFRRHLYDYRQYPRKGRDIGFVYMQVPELKKIDQTEHPLDNPVRLEFPLYLKYTDNPYPEIYDIAAAHLIRLQTMADSGL